MTQEKLANTLLSIIKFGIYLILFTPLLVSQKFLFPFIFSKTIFFRLIIEIILFCYLLLIIYKPKYRIRFSKLGLVILVFLTILVISGILGVNPYRSFWSTVERSEGIITLIHLFIFFLILSCIFLKKIDWFLLFDLAILATFIQGLYALGQYFKFSLTISYDQIRLQGSLGNASFLASYLLFGVFLALIMFFEKPKIYWRIYYGAVFLLGSFVIFHTQTRGAVFALIGGLVLFLFFNLIWVKKKNIKIATLVICLLIFGASAFIYFNKNQNWVKQNIILGRLTRTTLEDITVQNRLIVWQVGWQALKEKPFFGWGYENFETAFNKYFDPKIVRDIGSHPWYDRAHNVVVEMGVTAGFLGLISYLAIFILALYQLFQNLRKKNYNFYLNIGLICLILAYFFQNLFVFDTLNSYLMLFLVLSFINSQTLKPQKKRKIQPLLIKKPQLKFLIYLILPIILLVTIYWVNVRPALANYYVALALADYQKPIPQNLEKFQKAFQYSSPKNQELRYALGRYTIDHLKGPLSPETLVLTDFTIQELKRVIGVQPYSVQHYLLLAELYHFASGINPSFLKLAEETVLKASNLAPNRYQIYFSLGRIKFSQRQFPEGIDYFKKAIALNQNFAEAHWNLAIAYILTGQNNLVEVEFKIMENLNFPIYSQQNIDKLASAYRDARNQEKLIQLYQKAIELYPENTNYQVELEKLRRNSKL